jgi:hypothetical protein
VDVVGGPSAAARKPLADTLWIADWTFDGGFPCTNTGWQKVDNHNHILNDGTVHWRVDAAYTGMGGISGDAAVLGYLNNACCDGQDVGYGNDWHQGIRITYQGAATLSFHYVVDSEPDYDFLTVESDSACASLARVDYRTDPSRVGRDYRSVDSLATGFVTDGSVTSHPLADYGPGTHCVYIAFFSDGRYSPCHGFHPTTIGAGTVIDAISITDASGTRTEDFTDGRSGHRHVREHAGL